MKHLCKYDKQTIWPTLLEDIANGSSLSAALQKLDPVPSYWWAKDCLRRDPDLKAHYQEAVLDRADRLAEELLELADTPMPNGLEGRAVSAWVQQLRVRIDVRKWAASKLAPRLYGEKLDVSVTEARISITAALALAESRVLTLQESTRA